MRYGLPEDAGGFVALGLGLAALAAAPRLARLARARAVVPAAAALAAALSAAWIALYLRGGPRIVDATTYLLEARAIARGQLAFLVDEPAASTLGRFLVQREGPGGTWAAGLFPPGWPAVLAIGVRLGAPLAVGPALAAAIVVATAALARRVAARLPAGHGDVPAIAVGLSVVCGALRYHTADTMSHGLAALCATVALAAALDAVDPASSARRARGAALVAGLAGGWLAATRPVSAVAIAIAAASVALAPGAPPLAARARLAALAAIAAVPGLALLAAHQAAATGALFGSSQLAYYAQSDGPPGCFRFGFGEGIGCLGEHGAFVKKHLPDGYGLAEAVMTTLRRLKAHLVDATNAEPLALLVPIGAAVAWRAGAARAAVVALAAQILAYAPFYFDGNYPGGGARMFADVLPVEHVLAAVGAVVVARRLASRRGEAAARAASFAAIGLALVGFAVRAGFDHAQLRDRDGGLPMLEPARLAAAGATRGLVYVDTDHGHAIGFDPGAGDDAARVVRLRGDALDRLAWEARGRPPAYRYDFGLRPGRDRAEPTVAPFDPTTSPGDRIEGESLWPAASQRAAFAFPEPVEGGRVLRARPAGPADPGPRVVLGLPAALLRGHALAPRIAGAGRAVLVADGHTIATWPGAAGPALVPDGARRLTLELHPADAAGLALDRIDLVPPPGPARRAEGH